MWHMSHVVCGIFSGMWFVAFSVACGVACWNSIQCGMWCVAFIVASGVWHLVWPVVWHGLCGMWCI